MAVILNIETSNTACSVALTAEGMILSHRENTQGRNHAALVSHFIKDMLDFARDKQIDLDAVAVSMGPGSYTGLRIGLSEAKGIAYGLNIPLIGVSTLRLMATSVMFNTDIPSPDTILVPMLDARRMEVYTAAYDMALQPLLHPAPLVIEPQNRPYDRILQTRRPVLFFGSGMDKWRNYTAHHNLTSADITFIDNVEPLAVDMTALAEQAYIRRDFLDTAYSTPLYLKDFQATTPRKRI